MTRFLAAVTAGWIALGVTPAPAGQLAVGEVVPLYHPPGYVIRPVYVTAVRHSRWIPADTSYGVAFREPLYRAPNGYVFRHVRGYTRHRVAALSYKPVKIEVRKPVTKRAVKRRGGACVTELGYGRYDICS